MPDAATRPERAALAEESVRRRHLRRFWGYPAARLGVVSDPAPLHHRLFAVYHYWWQAHLLDCLVDAELRAPDAGRRALIRRLPRALLVRNGGRLVNDYFDDVAWLALAMGRARHELGLDVGRRHLQLARHLYDRWRADGAGGGIPWRVGDPFRNVPANGAMAVVMARLGRLRRARETLDWIHEHLVDPATGLVWDGRRPDGTDRRLFTYNQGIVLGAELELVRTGADAARLHALVDALDTHHATDGVLHGAGGGDGGLFAAITARYLADTARLLPGDTPRDAATRATAARLVRASADAAWHHRAEAGDGGGAGGGGAGGGGAGGGGAGGVWFGPDWRRPAVVPGAAGTVGARGAASDPPERDLSVQLGGWMVQELAARLDAEGVPVA